MYTFFFCYFVCESAKRIPSEKKKKLNDEEKTINKVIVFI